MDAETATSGDTRTPVNKAHRTDSDVSNLSDEHSSDRGSRSSIRLPPRSQLSPPVFAPQHSQQSSCDDLESINVIPGGDDGDVSDNDSDQSECQKVSFAKFGLTSADKSLFSYSCAIHARQGLGFVHGRMHLTPYFLAFQGWPDTRILLPLAYISQVEKGNTLQIIPNAIRMKYDNEEYFFGSFANRGKCFLNLCSLIDEAKKLVVPGKESEVPWAHRDLMFGWQKNNVLTIGTGYHRRSIWEAAFGPQHCNGIGNGSSLGPDMLHTESESNLNGSFDADTYSSGRTDKCSDDGSGGSARGRRKSSPPAVVKLETMNVRPPQPDEASDGISLGGLFEKTGISSILSKTLPHNADNVWDCLWRDADSFKEFLKSAGDKNIESTEWTPMQSPGIAEDVSKLPFTLTRSATYSHPQKKNMFMAATDCKVLQTQYCYVWGRNSSKIATGGASPVNSSAESGDPAAGGESPQAIQLQHIRPRRAMVLTVSQFEGIPFCDYFKVLVYYGFDDIEGSNRNDGGCNIRLGVAVHFCKSTMLKSQIQAGVISDFNEFGSIYFSFLKNRLQKLYPATQVVSIVKEPVFKEVAEPVVLAASNTVTDFTSKLFGLLPIPTIVKLLVGGYFVLLVLIIVIWKQNIALQQSVAQLEYDKSEFHRNFQIQFDMGKQLLQSQGHMEGQLKTQFDMLVKLVVTTNPQVNLQLDGVGQE